MTKNIIKRELFYNLSIENVFCLLSFPLLVIPAIPPFRSIDSISTWIKGYYYINYFDLGFIKRGFVGSIFRLSNISQLLSPSILVIVAHLFVSIIVGILFWRLCKASFENWSISNKLLFYSLFLFSPVLFLRLGYDVGRMDLWCLMLTLLTLISLRSNSYSYLINAAIVSLSISIQLLIHEASLLFYSPLIVCFYFYKYRINNSLKIKKVFPILTIPLFVGFMLICFGRYESTQEDLNLYLQGVHNELIGSMPMELTWSLKENIDFALNFLTPSRFLGGHYVVTTYYLFILFITFTCVRLPILIKLINFAPLFLSFLACDSTRFLASSAISFNLLFILAASENSLIVPHKLRIMIYIFSASFFVFGPWGISPVDPLPLLKHY